MNSENMRANHFILLTLVLAAGPGPAAPAQTPPNPTPDQLIQIMRSQPAVDVAAPVTATAAFDPPLVRPGEKSILRVTFGATEVSVSAPEKISAPAPLKLQRSVSGQSMQPTGGAMRIFSTFNYDARATRPGLFVVPEFRVEVYGKPVVVPATQLEVKAALPEPHEPVRQLSVETSATNVFVGETFNVSVRLAATSANGVEGVSQLQINGDGFIVDKNAVRQSIQSLETNGRKVPTFIYETSLTPISAGPLALSAQGFTAGMQFSGPITLTGQVSISGGPPKYLLLEADPVTINVQPLPTEKELPGFTGAIGSYSSDPPMLTTNRLTVGEPVTLTVIIHGQKNLNRINPPLPPRAPGWQIFPAVRGGIIAGVGTNHPNASFKYTLIPLSAAAHATPAIPFSCFDPEQGRFVDLTIPPVPVTVIADSTITNAEGEVMQSDNISGAEKATGLSRLAKTPGHTAGSLVPLQLRAWFPLVQLLPVFGFCGLWFWDRRRRFFEQHPDIVRRRQARRALRRALRSLEQSAITGDTAGFICSTINALQIVSAPHYPAEPRALVCSDVLEILSPTERKGKPGETVRRFFAAADAAAFASGAGTTSELLAEKSAVKEILAALEARL